MQICGFVSVWKEGKEGHFKAWTRGVRLLMEDFLLPMSSWGCHPHQPIIKSSLGETPWELYEMCGLIQNGGGLICLMPVPSVDINNSLLSCVSCHCQWTAHSSGTGKSRQSSELLKSKHKSRLEQCNCKWMAGVWPKTLNVRQTDRQRKWLPISLHCQVPWNPVQYPGGTQRFPSGWALHKIEREGTLAHSFYEAWVTLIPDKNTTTKRKLQTSFPDEHRCKIKLYCELNSLWIY